MSKTHISHLVDGDYETSEERLQQLSDWLLGLLVHWLDHHHNRLQTKQTRMVKLKDRGINDLEKIIKITEFFFYNEITNGRYIDSIWY